ncbi:hypothetical protein [Geotoga petraea]|uniref:Uncharacterized protein n=1 Tax=Geotoga petraea TaxID=28234 RepID=A0A4Z0VYD1_9BACT|nr:hypothetical protein [Geotoga petraea]TGG89011.1 hypothetical protein E4650_02115 [Geotoga petraea]
MILIRPFLVFIALMLFYIPNLQFIGIAILLYIYHILTKNRNSHIEKMKEVYKANGIDFPIKDSGKKTFVWLYLYIFSLTVLFYMANTLTSEVLALDINQIEQFQVEPWESYLLIGSFVLMWVSYTFMINKIIKDQWILQESEINNNIVKYRFISLREGNFSMLLRILTFNLYEWYLIYMLLRETAMHYIEDGTATGVYKKHIEKPKKEEIKKESPFENLINKIKNLDKEEKYSVIFYEVTNMQAEKAEEVLKKLLEENYIDQEEYDKIKSFL